MFVIAYLPQQPNRLDVLQKEYLNQDKWTHGFLFIARFSVPTSTRLKWSELSRVGYDTNAYRLGNNSFLRPYILIYISNYPVYLMSDQDVAILLSWAGHV